MGIFGIRDSLVRRLVLRVFKHINLGNIRIKHHWIPGNKIGIHSFRHKGYWWHGANREKESIRKFFNLIGEGDTVIEIGGHVGYFSMIYSHLIKESGRLFVFEPGTNNIPYIQDNLKDLNNSELIEKAVSDKTGQIDLYIENLSGQNNSIIKDYHLLDGNIKYSGIKDISVETISISSTTLDDFVEESKIQNISFIKIDIEGAELLALQGANNTLKKFKPNMMIEVTENQGKVFEILDYFEYELYEPSGIKISVQSSYVGNVFCLNSNESVSKFLKSEVCD